MTALRSAPTDDLRAVRDWLDEHEVRYEVLDGGIVVTPPTGFAHESLVMLIGSALVQAGPPGLAVVGSSYGSYYDGDSFLMSDVSVVREADAAEEDTRVPPLLVVEVLSRSTRRRDLLVKREIYAEWGVPSYWLVDPLVPALTVLSLQGGAYVEAAASRGDEELELDEPYPVVVRLVREVSRPAGPARGRSR